MHEGFACKLSNAGVSLTDEEYITLVNDRLVSVTVKYGRFSYRALTVDFIETEAKQKWTYLTDVPFSLHSDNKRKHEINDRFLQVCALPITVFLKASQQDFSLFTKAEALDYAGVKMISIVTREEESRFFPPPIATPFEGENKRLLDHTLEDLKNRHNVFDPLEEGCKHSTRRENSPRKHFAHPCPCGVDRWRQIVMRTTSGGITWQKGPLIGLPTVEITEST